MQIFVLEHLSVRAADAHEDSLAEEGFAMLRASCLDLASQPGIDVFAAVHPRLMERAELEGLHVIAVSENYDRLASIAASFDGVLLIAPEIDGVASDWARRLERSGATLLGPSSTFIAWASDKLAVAQTFSNCSPPTIVLGARQVPMDWGDELVLKPRDGVGSLFTMAVCRKELQTAARIIRSDGYEGDLIVQPRIHGRAVSVALVAARSDSVIQWPGVEQFIEAVPCREQPSIRRLEYRGGIVPLDGFVDRVVDLARDVSSSAPCFRGWIGIDVILATDGRDVVVDVNPRLTTSYLGYSHLFPGIPARMILGRATNADLEVLRRSTPRRARFDTKGRVEFVA